MGAGLAPKPQANARNLRKEGQARAAELPRLTGVEVEASGRALSAGRRRRRALGERASRLRGSRREIVGSQRVCPHGRMLLYRLGHSFALKILAAGCTASAFLRARSC